MFLGDNLCRTMARIDAPADPKARNSADSGVPADKVNGAIAPVFIPPDQTGRAGRAGDSVKCHRSASPPFSALRLDWGPEARRCGQIPERSHGGPTRAGPFRRPIVDDGRGGAAMPDFLRFSALPPPLPSSPVRRPATAGRACSPLSPAKPHPRPAIAPKLVRAGSQTHGAASRATRPGSTPTTTASPASLTATADADRQNCGDTILRFLRNSGKGASPRTKRRAPAIRCPRISRSACPGAPPRDNLRP